MTKQHPLADKPAGTFESMVQRRLVFGADDLVSIRLTCCKCKNEAVWRSMGSAEHPPTRCLFCGSNGRWMDSGLWSVVDCLGKALKTIREQDKNNEKFSVQFEIEIPKAEASQ